MRRYSKNPRPLSPATKVILIAFGLVFILSRLGCSKPTTSTIPKDTLCRSTTSERAAYGDKDTTPDNQHAEIADVTRAVDGDTIVVAMNGRLYKMRFIGNRLERGFNPAPCVLVL